MVDHVVGVTSSALIIALTGRNKELERELQKKVQELTDALLAEKSARLRAESERDELMQTIFSGLEEVDKLGRYYLPSPDANSGESH